MSFKQVKELRQAGKLDEAYQLAALDLEAEKAKVVDKSNTELQGQNPPNLIWAKRALAWVLYESIKQNATNENYEAFLKYLTQLAGLELPEGEKMVFDNIAWQAGKMLFDIHRQEKPGCQKVDAIFDLIKAFHFTKPSEAYSFLYKAFHKGYQEWPRYLEFADWWEFRHFRPEDCLKEEMPNGKMAMSLMEQACIAYAKKLLQGEPSETDPFQNEVNAEKIQAFMPLLDQIIDQHPEYLYPPYFKAKLLLFQGTNEKALEAFLPFAKAKRQEFWVWDVMADIFPNEPEKQIACYCKALSCRSADEFLSKVRLKLAKLLLNTNKLSEAKTEIECAFETLQAKGWKIPNQIMSWKNSTWFKEAKPFKDNRRFYTSNAPTAERLLFADIPEEFGVVEFVNKDKKILHFIVNRDKHGFLKYGRHLKNVQIGDFIKVRFDSRSSDGYYKVLTLGKTEAQPDAPIVRDFEGKISIHKDNPFGFVGDIFIDPATVRQQKLADGASVRGRAILSFNRKRQDWGWKAVKVFDSY